MISSSVRFNSPMSRAIDAKPTRLPEESRMGETETATSTVEPSFLTRTVSKRTALSPALSFSSTSRVSLPRSGDSRIETGWPSISVGE